MIFVILFYVVGLVFLVEIVRSLRSIAGDVRRLADQGVRRDSETLPE